MTTSKFIQTENYTFEYFVFGNGDNTTIAFHGFGKSASRLDILQNYIPNNKIIAINLPYHGSSKPINTDATAVMTNNEIKSLVNQLIEKESIDEFNLFGYSLGAKIALKIIELSSYNIKKLILFAPDGLKVNFWYNVTVSNALMRNIFKQTVKNPRWFFQFIKFLHFLKLITNSLYKFIVHHFNNPTKRKIVYEVWSRFRNIHPNIKKVKREIIMNKIEVQLFFGKYDRVIPPSSGKSFIRGIDENCKLKILGGGHNLISNQYLKYIQ